MACGIPYPDQTKLARKTKLLKETELDVKTVEKNFQPHFIVLADEAGQHKKQATVRLSAHWT